MPDSITSFTLERSTDGSNWSQVSGSPLAGSARSYTDTTTGPSLYYRLTGHTSEGLDFLYNIVQVTSTGGWVKMIGGTGSDGGNAAAVDSTGNIIVCGAFSGSVTFGTINGQNVSRTSAGSFDMFLAKYSQGGLLVWVKTYGLSGGSEQGAKTIALDTVGNIYVSGKYSGTINLGGSDLTSNTNNGDPFLAKYDSSGNHVWSIDFLKGTISDYVNQVVTDSSDNVYVVGSFQNGQGQPPLAINNGHTLVSEFNSIDAFVIKFNSSSACQWAKNFFNYGATEDCFSVAVMGDGNLAVAGFSQSGISLGGSQLTYGGFLGKISSANGAHIWSRSMAAPGPGNTETDAGPGRVFGIGVDAQDNILCTGYFAQARSYFGGYASDPNSGLIIGGAAYVDMFIAKYTSTGVLVWAKPLPGTLSGNPLSLAVDAQGSFAITGYFVGTVNFGGQSIASSPGINNGFVAKYSAAGSLLWVKGVIGGGASSLNSVCFDPIGSPVLAGNYSGTPTFNGQTLTNAGGSDIILAKLNP